MPLSTSHTESIQRSYLYKLLSLGFRYPTPETFQTFQNGEFLARLWSTISLLPHVKFLKAEHAEQGKKAQNSLGKNTFEDFVVKVIQTFDCGIPEPPCPPYEGFYRNRSRTAVMLDITEFYKHFGLAMSKRDGKCELPDHLCAELEFLHFLAFKEAHARINEDSKFLEGYLLAQKDFLSRHPVQWIPKFYDSLCNRADIPFYNSLTRVTVTFITHELELITSRVKPFSKEE
ncbi:MAG: Cytoplasmic chaperone TorD [Candidatus Jettenia ecosi]|uniref:Cytoplasmic chaperone TorD n=1 Tax=Candidatus Jettenia ecosi TaxID=2494326 RepID=A0A533QCK6_9BACT|nr:MAG: Cytoplasmic chaperone TorD [Candidatus Jettenia ecosi]